MKRTLIILSLFSLCILIVSKNILSTTEKIVCSSPLALKEKISLNPELKSKYGGMYIDDNGTININYIGTYCPFEISNDYINTKFNKVKYSITDLERVNNILNKQMKSLQIASMGISEKKNKIIIYLKTLDESTKNNIISLIKDSSIIEFYKADSYIKTSNH